MTLGQFRKMTLKLPDETNLRFGKSWEAVSYLHYEEIGKLGSETESDYYLSLEGSNG